MNEMLVHLAAWLVPALFLIPLACYNFNLPPTNRYGTTFLLFYLGLSFYTIMLGVTWLLLMGVLQNIPHVSGALALEVEQIKITLAPLAAFVLLLCLNGAEK